MAMQLRSGRRLGSPVPVPAPRGDLRRVRPRRCQDGGDDDGGQDPMSSLPKDMRLEVLARLPCTRDAMRTSVLSKPWHRLWTELRELTFDRVADVDCLLSALTQVQPKLNRLWIRTRSNMVLGGPSISSLLCAADKLEPLQLVVIVRREHGSKHIVLPCFARATSIELRILSGMWFKLPRTGSFTSLERLTLSGAGSIDPGVLLPRCPRLRSLNMNGNCPRRATTLVVESSSLDELKWHLRGIKQPVDVHVVAPNLKDFVFSSLSRKFAMSLLSAPKLEEFYLDYSLEDSTVGFVENQRWRHYELKLEMAQRHILSLYVYNVLIIPPVERSFEQEVAWLPVTIRQFSALELYLRTEGHVFGALVLQLLRIRAAIKRLKVVLCTVVAQFKGFCGHDYEMDFLKLLFGSAPSLKTMSVRHSNKASIVRGACQKLHDMFSANASSVSFSFS